MRNNRTAYITPTKRFRLLHNTALFPTLKSIIYALKLRTNNEYLIDIKHFMKASKTKKTTTKTIKTTAKRLTKTQTKQQKIESYNFEQHQFQKILKENLKTQQFIIVICIALIIILSCIHWFIGFRQDIFALEICACIFILSVNAAQCHPKILHRISKVDFKNSFTDVKKFKKCH